MDERMKGKCRKEDEGKEEEGEKESKCGDSLGEKWKRQNENMRRDEKKRMRR